MSVNVIVPLPHGIWNNGTHIKEAQIRSLTGEDEAFFYDTDSFVSNAQKTSELLARCVTHVGSLTPVTIETVRSLTVGDREALLLHIRRTVFGNRIQAGLICNNEDCGEKMDLDLDVNELLLPPYAHAKETYEVTLEENNKQYRVRFRLPNGGDQEAIAPLALTNPNAAAEQLLKRCIKQVSSSDNDYIPEPPSEVLKQLPAIMADLDPQAEIILNLTCPACGSQFSSLLDTASYLFRELDDHTNQLFREVQLLAFYHHWSEADILRMNMRRRGHYIDNLAETLRAGT